MNITQQLLERGIAVRGDGPIEQRVPCPRCDRGPRDRALGVNIERGAYHCFRCGFSGRVGVSEPIRGFAPTSCAQEGAGAAISPPPATPLSPELWNQCRELAGAALAYLRARHCVIPPAEGHLRWHEHLRHPCGYVGPALVALVTDALTGEPMTLHRTWINADGTKAAIELPRLLLAGHPKKGGVIRLFPEVTQALAVGEGVETCLSAAHVFTPIWSTVDAGNLAGLPLLAGIQALRIFADCDLAGMSAARALGRRWADAGLEVSITTPLEPGVDFNDVVRSA